MSNFYLQEPPYENYRGALEYCEDCGARLEVDNVYEQYTVIAGAGYFCTCCAEKE